MPKSKKSEVPTYFLCHSAEKFAKEERRILKAQRIRELQHLQPLLDLLDGKAGRTIVSVSRAKK